MNNEYSLPMEYGKRTEPLLLSEIMKLTIHAKHTYIHVSIYNSSDIIHTAHAKVDMNIAYPFQIYFINILIYLVIILIYN